MALSKLERRQRIKRRIRKIAFGTATKPRLSVFRSNKEIYAQLVDDNAGTTLVAVSSRDKEIELEKKTKIESQHDAYNDKGKLVEVVLTDKKSPEWHDALKRIGYVEVSRFKNHATGNICIIYHYYK